MELSVIIVSYNVQPYLEQCLFALRKALKGHDAEVWVVDNASVDGTTAWLKAVFPDIHCVELPENVGFARANNIPLDRVKGKYILFLNPDTLILEDTIDKCMAFMDAHEDAGALGLRMLNGFGAFLRESKRGIPTASAALFKLLGLAGRYPKSKTLAAYYAGNLDDRQTNVVPVLSGAFFLVRSAVIQAVGSFDETFFMYGEDIDLSYRITRAGWKNYFFADSMMIHFKGQSTDKKNKAYEEHFYGAMVLFIQKYYHGPAALFYRWLLKGGIFLQKNLEGPVRKLFEKYPRHWTPETARRHFVLVGSQRDLDAFLKTYDPGRMIYLQFDPMVTPIEHLHGYMEYDGSLPVLFLLGDLTLKKSIEWLDQSGWEPPCFFHDMQSGNIVGPGRNWPIPFRLRTPV